jgi:hypothetical protein
MQSGDQGVTKTRGFRGDGNEPAKRQALLVSAEALRKAAERKLPRPLERKIKKMLEDKESLSDREYKELLTLVELAQGQLVQKVRAEVALKLLEKAYPELKGLHWRASASGSISIPAPVARRQHAAVRRERYRPDKLRVFQHAFGVR